MTATRDFRKEMFACIIGAFGNGPHFVDVPCHDGTVFRCKPSVEGGVILRIGRQRRQYCHLSMDEWVEWAREQETRQEALVEAEEDGG